MKNNVSTFHAPDAPECNHDPQSPPDAKTQVRHNMPDAIFMESALVPPKPEKVCVDVSQLRRTGLHYVTRRSHGMQKHKFSVTCPGALFGESTPVPPQLEK
jgi:hypothetical protein